MNLYKVEVTFNPISEQASIRDYSKVSEVTSFMYSYSLGVTTFGFYKPVSNLIPIIIDIDFNISDMYSEIVDIKNNLIVLIRENKLKEIGIC